MAQYRVYNGKTKTEPYEGFRGKIVDFPLKPTVAAWARGALADGAGLSRILLDALDFSKGSWSALLPEDTPQDSANAELDEGVLPEPPVSTWETLEEAEMDSWSARNSAEGLGCSPSELVVVPKPTLDLFLANGIRHYLKATPDGLCLAEHALANASDRCIRDDPLRPWTSEEDVYYPIHDRRFGIELIADILDAATSWRQTVVFTTIPRAVLRSVGSTRELTGAMLRDLAQRAQRVVLMAYDGESYVVWRPDSSPEYR